MKKHLIIAALLLAAIGLKAQQGEIYFKDYDPDSCKFITWSDFVPSTMDSLQIDINDDGLYDTWITGYVQHGALLPITFMSDGWELCYPNENTILDSDTLRWESYDDWVSGCFDGKYGFRLKNGDMLFYGWMSAYCDMKSSKSIFKEIGRNVYVDKIAFCTIPNYPLRWGQTSLNESIDENGYTTFATIHPNPTKGIVAIMGENLKQAEVLNMLGQQVLSVQGEGNELRIDMAALPAGVYFVNVTNDEGRKCVRKVVRE